MKKALGFFLLAFFVLINYSFAEKNSISLSRIKDAIPYYQADDIVSVYGSNFGTDTSKLKLYINDQSHKIEKSYGNEVQFKLTKDSRSGLLYITKSYTDENGKTSTLETNRLEIDLFEPSIEKIEAKEGLSPGSEVVFSGKNLNDAKFACDEIELHPKLQGEKKVIISLENTTLNCSFNVEKRGFKFDSSEKIQLSPLLYYFQILSKKEYIHVYGKGFDAYKESISDFEINFVDKTLKDAEYISDTEIRFPHSTTIASRGLSTLKIKDTQLPSISYSFSKNIPYISEVSNPELTKDGQFIFEIFVSEALNEIYRNEGEVFMNGQKIEGEVKGRKLEIIQKSLPEENGEIWVEMNKLQGKHFKYNFNLDFKPQVIKIQPIVRKLDSSGGRIRVEGSNFYPKDSVKISSSAGELKITQLQSNSFQAFLPSPLKEGNYSLSVSNSYGNSNSINFSIPATLSKRFYPDPKITRLEYPQGPFSGSSVKIYGEGLAHITSVNYEGNGFKPRWSNTNTLEAIIPKKIEKSGKLTVSSNFLNESNSLDYKIYSKPKRPELTMFFPTKKSVHLIEKEAEFQTILHFSLKNTQEPLLASFTWKISCNTSKDCLKVLPFTAYQLVDSNDKIIEDLSYEIDAQNKTLSIKNINIAASGRFLHYSLEAKMQPITKDEIRNIKLISASAKDMNEKSLKIDKKTRAAKLYMRRSENSKSYCKEFSEEKWQDCKKERKRPSKK